MSYKQFFKYRNRGGSADRSRQRIPEVGDHAMKTKFNQGLYQNEALEYTIVESVCEESL